MHHDLEQHPHRIDEQVTFTPVHFLPAIISMKPTALRRFDRLAINDASTGRRLASRLHAQALAQRSHELFPDACIAPLAKVVIDRSPGRALMREPPPRPATAQHITNSV